MLELDHLTVSGDVTFGKNVSLKVIILVLYYCDSRDCTHWIPIPKMIVNGAIREKTFCHNFDCCY